MHDVDAVDAILPVFRCHLTLVECINVDGLVEVDSLVALLEPLQTEVLRCGIDVLGINLVVRHRMAYARLVGVGIERVERLEGVQIALHGLQIACRVESPQCLAVGQFAGEDILHLVRLYQRELLAVDDHLCILGSIVHVALHPVYLGKHAEHCVIVAVGLAVSLELVILRVVARIGDAVGLCCADRLLHPSPQRAAAQPPGGP